MFLAKSIFWLALTCGIGVFWARLQKSLGWAVLNPLLLCLITLFAILTLFSVPYDEYHKHTVLLDYLIEPAVVLFGYPLFRQLKMIGQYWWQLGLSCFTAVLFTLTLCALLADFLGIEHWVIHSLVMISTTTAIAMETTEALGGSPSLAAAMVLVGGLTGCTLGLFALTRFGISDERARGVAMGSFAHAVGTATIARESYTSAAYASTALILCATLTAVIAPYYVPFLLVG